MLKVNDRVKIIGVNENGANNYIGAEGNVISIGYIYAYVNGIKMKSGTFGAWFPIKSLEKVEPAPEPKFKKGDRVYIKDNAINCPAGNATVDSFYLYQEKLECDAYRVINDEGDKYVALERDMTLIDNKITIEVGDEQKKENSDSFYCCYVEGKSAPVMQHPTQEEAEKEAERLARKENRKVYVLKAIKSCEIPDSPVKWNNL